jgi:hypothetical protein
MSLHALEPSRTPAGPTRPDRITIWPIDDERFGIDVVYRGALGYRRAEIVQQQLTDAAVAVTFRQETDGAWAVRFGPVMRDEMLAALNGVVW